MKAVQRLGDPDTAGGIALVGDSTVLVNGLPIIVTGNPVTPHPPFPPAPPSPPHQSATVVASQGTVLANGKAVVLTGDTDTCGHTRTGGSQNVFVGS